MARPRSTTTVEIKPSGLAAAEIKPAVISAIDFLAYTKTTVYGEVTYGEVTYGNYTASVGQQMPILSTREV